MSNAQNSHGKSPIMQSQPLDIAPNRQRFQQVPQQPSTTPMKITEAYSRPVGKIILLKIIDPITDREIDLNNSSQGPPDFIIMKVQSILNEITPVNIPSITERFNALPIDTIERLEKTIDLVFEKAIEEKSFAHLCSILCSSMQFLEVSTKYGQTTSFKKLIISKCQSLFELDKAQEMDAAKKHSEINSCKDPEKKKELQLEFKENERRLRKRSVGNCRFMGELFKRKILTPNIMLYCIVDLVTKHDEEPLECLCILLKTVGKELEQSYDLNDTFDKLTALTFSDMKSKISSRIQFMIQDVINLRRHKWISEKQDCLRGGRYKNNRENKSEWNVSQNKTKYKQQHYIIDQSNLQGYKENAPVATLNAPKWSFTTGKNMTFTSRNPYAVHNDDKKPPNSPQIMSKKTTTRKLQFPRPIPSKNSSSSQPKESFEEQASELVSEIDNKINLKCINLLYEYDQLQNLDDIINSLLEDETSVIYTRFEEFVKSMSFISLDNSSITQSTVAGKIFAELVSKNILSMDAVTRGINAVLEDSNEHLIDYPNFFTHIAAIIAPLLLSQNASLDFNNLKDFCTSIRPDNSSILFNEFLNKISSINSSSSQPKESFEEPVPELDSEIDNKINLKCLNLLFEYEQMQNLDDIINSLLEDETSVIYTRFEEFVKSMSFISLDNSSITQSTVAGKIFAELVSKNILSMDAVTRGIDAVLEDSNEHLIDYPNFFSHIAAIIAPLLLSQNASLDFNNLKDFCKSIRPDNSSKFFTQVLNKILSSKETQNIKEQLVSILWIYNKWNASEKVTLDVFMPNNEINKYFKNDQIGIVILSIVIYDKMKLTNNKLLYNILQSWICTNISEEIIKNPLFVKSLTIAILIVCLKLNHSYDDFFDPVHVKLLSHFIEFEPLPVHEIQAREVQCMYGIQIMSATLKHPGGMVLKLFNKLYHHRVISKESFELFIQEYEEITEI